MVTRAMVRAIARTRPIETIGQAYEWLRTRALPRGVAFLTEGGMNTERTHQDDGVSLSGVRRAIYSLLPSPQRRRFFFEMASSKEGLLRLRQCFGAPPYAFLHPSDMFALNAGAIGLRRTHLSYEHGSQLMFALCRRHLLRADVKMVQSIDYPTFIRRHQEANIIWSSGTIGPPTGKRICDDRIGSLWRDKNHSIP